MVPFTERTELAFPFNLPSRRRTTLTFTTNRRGHIPRVKEFVGSLVARGQKLVHRPRGVGGVLVTLCNLIHPPGKVH